MKRYTVLYQLIGFFALVILLIIGGTEAEAAETDGTMFNAVMIQLDDNLKIDRMSIYNTSPMTAEICENVVIILNKTAEKFPGHMAMCVPRFGKGLI